MTPAPTPRETLHFQTDVAGRRVASVKVVRVLHYAVLRHGRHFVAECYRGEELVAAPRFKTKREAEAWCTRDALRAAR